MLPCTACNSHVISSVNGYNQFTRLLAPHAPKRPYKKPSEEERGHPPTLHWGQRKLLLSEIEFLTLYGQLSREVVYIGAAPGTHILILAALFPNHHFYLYDSQDFNPVLRSQKNITCYQTLFTLETASIYQSRPILLISDIRTANGQLSFEAFEDCVGVDMNFQKKIYETIIPVKALFKFRFPFIAQQFDYLVGDIYLPVWGKFQTAEARLVPQDGIKAYDVDGYNDQMHYFNVVERVRHYQPPMLLENPSERGYCYDCTAEITILSQYLQKIGKVSQDAIGKEVVKLSREISTSLHNNSSNENSYT